MKKIRLAAAALALIPLVLIAPVRAGLLDTLHLGSGETKYLEPDKAFGLDVTVRDPYTLVASFRVTPKYYLYRSKVKFTLVAPDASIGPHVVVERQARVGSRTRLAANVTLGEGVEVGADCILYPRVTVYPGARIGERVILHSGVVIGSDGFGYVFAEGRHHKFPQLGSVAIENDVEIGSNTTVDRGSLGTTVIGEGTKIDNLVQIAHNVRIGRHSVIAAQTGISGSSEIGNYVVMAGQVGVGPHVHIEDQAIIAGQSGVLDGKTVRKGSTVWGTPARPIAQIKKMYASLARLPDLTRIVDDLSRRLPRSGH